MDYLTLGLQEIGRRATRVVTRGRLALVRHERGKALTELGLLGWQQADFDDETQAQVDAIQNVEREQSRLINEAAEIGNEVRRLTSERDAERRTHQEKLRVLEADFRRTGDLKAQLERNLEANRKTDPNFERRIPELDRELREVNRAYSEMLQQERHTPKAKQDMIHLRERIVAIPNEKADLRTQHLRAATEIRALEESLARQSELAAAAQHLVREASAEWHERESGFNSTIRTQEKAKAALEREMAALERAKANPYLRIGEVLAASGIGPINQPQTLDRVRQIEVQIVLLEEAISTSRAASAEAAGTKLTASLIFWALAALLVVLLIFRLLS